MTTIRPLLDTPFDLACDVVVIGAGACGLTAGLRAQEAGAEVIVLERDATPSGSTAMSSGFVPAPGTRFQKSLGIEDSPDLYARDLQKKAANGADEDIVEILANEIGPALEWLADRHGLEWDVLDDFLYPGHSAHRMHAVPERTGAGLTGRLLNAAEAADLTLVTSAHARTLLVDETRRIGGIVVERPDGTAETIGCKALILACNGYGGNREMVCKFIPKMAGALYYGHAGNQGDALLWGEKLGAAVKDLGAYQGHGSLAHPHGILITWALMMEGAIQVNAIGKRFSNEHAGYSEQAEHVLEQPGGFAWNIYDQRLHEKGLEFPDYREAEKAGAILSARSLEELAQKCFVQPKPLKATLDGLKSGKSKETFGRDFANWKPFEPPFYAVRVTGAVFHTQGGLLIDDTARVLDQSMHLLPNLYAAGGAACGVSGASVEGYLSGNGLLSAIGLGYIAGRAAAVAAMAT